MNKQKLSGKELQPPSNQWPQDRNGNAGLFIAQAMVELLDLKAFESFRLQALDVASRIEEVVSLIEQRLVGKIRFSTIKPAKEELYRTLSEDRVADLVTEKKMKFVLKELGQRSEDKPEHLAYCKHLLRQIRIEILTNYKERLESELIEKYNENGKRRELRVQINRYLSFVHNAGYSREYIQKTLRERFFSKNISRFNSNILKGFFNDFQMKTKSYRLFLPISEATASLLQTIELKNFNLHEISTLPADARTKLENHRHFHQADRYLEGEVDRLDEFSATRFCQDLLSSLTSLSALQWDGFDFRWKDHAYISLVGRRKGELVSLEGQRFTNRAKKISGGRARRLRNQTQSIIHSFDAESMQRLLSSAEYVSLARNSTTPNNQLILLWSAIETLMGDPPGEGSRIGHFISHMVPAICADYQKRYLSAIYYRLRRFHRKQVQVALNRAEIPNELPDKTRFIHFTFDPQFREFHRDFLTSINSNQLALFHLGQLFSKFSTPELLVRSIADHEQRVRWQVYRIYRIRNDLVHGGQRPRYLGSIAMNAFEYYSSAFFTVAEAPSLMNVPDRDLDEIISQLAFSYENFKNQMKNLDLEQNSTDLGTFLDAFQTRETGTSKPSV